jgi:hypothetical protein
MKYKRLLNKRKIRRRFLSGVREKTLRMGGAIRQDITHKFIFACFVGRIFLSFDSIIRVRS